jgi:CubicO group peptidase (beta-lactamase class C family)
MNRFITRVVILFLSLLALSFGYAQESSPTDIATAMDEVVTKIAASSLFSGSVLVAQNGNILLSKGYGLADREQNISNTPQTVFRIGSMGKQFTAMGIMILQAQGKLDVQDLICNYLSECPEKWQAITIHHLLTHSSGVIGSGGSADKIIKFGATAFEPGTKFSYSDSGFVLLGAIIEQVSGQSYETFMEEMIFDPLKMTSTNFTPHQENEAVGYVGKYEARYEELTEIKAAGGHYSTVEDLYLWDQALYTEQLIPQELLETVFSPHIAITSIPIAPYEGETNYGYGWIIGQEGTHKAIGHPGALSGFRTMISRYPDDKLTIIVLSNREDVSIEFVVSLLAKKVFGEE